MSNSVDPDETAHDGPSHLDLCCLQKHIFITCGSERVNKNNDFPKSKLFLRFKHSHKKKCFIIQN